MSSVEPRRVVDLFSGGGGMSYGFHARSDFQIVAAADAQLGKPSSKPGSLGCNSTYEANIGIAPAEVDLAAVSAADLPRMLGLEGPVDVLAACPPCTGFTRTNANNHLVDDMRNNLVRRIAEFAYVLQPEVIVMENARELLRGNFAHHFDFLAAELNAQNYKVHSAIHLLDRFGLPQTRERAIVIAVRAPSTLYSLDDLWRDLSVASEATTVRRAIGHLPPIAAGVACATDPDHVSPSFTRKTTRARIAAIPHDGGSWRDLLGTKRLHKHLTPAMVDLAWRNKLGNHPDVYGRARWDSPSVTIKRECSHVGNGRYAHPDQDRLLSLREIALLNGFPAGYDFRGKSLANRYRHVGDAVPPLISFQIAAAVSWTLSGRRPNVEEFLLPGTNLQSSDIVRLAGASVAT